MTATYTIAGYEFVVNAPAAYFFQDGSQYGNPEPNKGLYISKQGAIWHSRPSRQIAAEGGRIDAYLFWQRH
ncbi:MAG: hypothetical protein ACLS37_13780 [Alistipes sp.]